MADFLLLLAVLSTEPTFAERILRCHDGDTCTVQDGPRKFSVRLPGIDAPELTQENGREAKHFLEGLIKGKDVRLECKGKSYKRRLCRIYLGSMDVQEAMVAAGWAWDSPKYSKGKYRLAERAARAAKKGIWAKEFEHSPHCFRRKGMGRCFTEPHFQP